jgi:uncharacterized lipoprotein YddW (UPF0748 family)
MAFTPDRPWPGARTAAALIALLCSITATAQPVSAPQLAVTAANLESTESIRRVIASAASSGASTLVVSLSMYAAAEGGFDGVAVLLRAAHDRGLRVHASVASNVVSAIDELPASRDHVLYHHPEWLMVPRDIAAEMLRIDVRSPGYLGRLSRWARSHAQDVAGLYLSPMSPAAADYAAKAVEALVRRYAFDVIDIHAAPYPDAFDYSRQAMDAFKAAMRARLDSAERARMDAVEELDPFAYADEFPEDWTLFRRARLDDLVSRVGASARAARPSILLASGDSADAPAAP